MLPFICLLLIHAAHSRSAGFEFKIKGGGKYDGDKFVLDVHVEGGNATTTLAPTISSFTTTPGMTPNQTSTIMPSQTPTPTPSSASNATTAPPITTASTTAGTTLSVNSSTTPAVGSNATTAPGEEVNVTPPTPAPEFNDHSKAGVSNLFSKVERTALQLHNYYRSIHEAPLLIFDAKLRKDAQEYADKVARNKLLRPEQDFVLSSKNEGENLGFRCSVTRPDPAKALREIMKRWYDEGCKYNFQTPPPDKYNSRHFTQMIWQGSRRLGVGISYGKVNNLQCLYYVARYRPRGNISRMLSYLNNVKKGVFDKFFCRPVNNVMSNPEVVLKD